MPPLTRRREDIPLLASHFLHNACRRLGRDGGPPGAGGGGPAVTGVGGRRGIGLAIATALREQGAEVTVTGVGEGDAELGRELSAACASCHGDDGNANGTEMPTLAGQDARYFIKAMQAYQNGSRQHEGMFGAVESLDDKAIADLAAFYALQEPVQRNVRAPLTTSEWIDRCARCHGIDGNSTDPRFPMLAGQDPTYLANALRAYIDKTRSNSAMHAMSAPLSENDLRRIVDYYASREPRSVVYMVLPCEDATESE